MLLKLSPDNLARVSARHPWRVIALWGALIVLSFVLVGSFLSGALTTEARNTNSPDSTVGLNLLEERLRGPFQANEAVIIQSDNLTVEDPAFQAKVETVLGEIRALGPEVIANATSFYEIGLPTLVSEDRRSTLLPVLMAGSVDDANSNVGQVIDIVRNANEADGFAALISGFATINHDFNEAAERDLRRAEVGPLPLAFIILILVFGAVIAAFVPIILAIFAVVVALAITAVVGQTWEFSFFVTNMIVMMGLAVGIDYSLFILSRYREERARGLPIQDALGVAGGTAGRAVFFSGLTVIIALSGLLIIPHTIFQSLASGAIFVVFASVVASLTLLPAVLSLLGDRVDRFQVPFIQRAQRTFDEEVPGGIWDRIARTVMARPVPAVVLSVAILVALAIPFFSINLGMSGVSSLPQSFTAKQGFDVLESEFSGGQVNPIEIVIDGDVNSPAVQEAVQALQAAATSEPVLGPATFEANPAGDLGLLAFQLRTDAFSNAAVDAAERLREVHIPAAFANTDVSVYVTGTAALNLDMFRLTDQYTPYVFAFVLGLSFILLMLVFRSLVVPLKSIIMNLLSVGSAYGVLVLVFQQGYGTSLFGFQQVESIEAWLPLFLFAVLFGLSMDYHVFLLSRIRERYDHIHDNTESIAFGVRSTGRLITGAALIMVTVFCGFALGDLVMMQQMGFGLGISVLLDATLIRCVLVPASMKLLGDWNWYLPPVLRWLPRIGIEGAVSQPEPTPAPVGGGGS